MSGSAETTVVIIVSVSLALLVCAIIPLIFYGHCRSNPGEVTYAHRHTCAHTLLSVRSVISHQNVAFTCACTHKRSNESRLFVSEAQNKPEANNAEVSHHLVIHHIFTFSSLMTALKFSAQKTFGVVMILIYLQADCCEQNADVASTQAAVRLQSVDEPESKPQDASQYAAIYQELDSISHD